MANPFSMSQYTTDFKVNKNIEDPNIGRRNAVGVGMAAYAGMGFVAGVAGTVTDPIAGKLGREYKKKSISDLLTNAGFEVKSIPSRGNPIKSGVQSLNPGMAAMGKREFDPWKIMATKNGQATIVDTEKYFDGTTVQGTADGLNFLFNKFK